MASLVTQHELQHIETMLATHQLRVGRALLSGAPLPPGRPVRGGREDAVLIPEGPALIGADAEHEPGSLDNERPRHAVALEAFRIGRVPVTNAEWLEFMAAGGYTDRRWWDADGWAHRQQDQLQAPLFWSPDGAGGWTRRRFGQRGVDARPVSPSSTSISMRRRRLHAGPGAGYRPSRSGRRLRPASRISWRTGAGLGAAGA